MLQNNVANQQAAHHYVRTTHTKTHKTIIIIIIFPLQNTTFDKMDIFTVSQPPLVA